MHLVILINRARIYTHAHIYISFGRSLEKKNGVVFSTNGENDALSSSSSGRRRDDDDGRFLGRREKDDIYNGFITKRFTIGERKNSKIIE